MADDLTNRLYHAIVLDFEGRGEAWTTDRSGDTLAHAAAVVAEREVRDHVAARVAEVERERDEARGERPSGFWSQREWEVWSNDLAALIPEDLQAGNPDGAQESIIADTIRSLVDEVTALRERLARVEELCDDARRSAGGPYVARVDVLSLERALAGTPPVRPRARRVTVVAERTYTLEDFAGDVDVEHELTARRLPVLRSPRSRWQFHVALVIGRMDWMAEGDVGLEPEPWEADQLCVYLEKHMRYYNDGYRARVAARGPFDVDSTVNTHTFRKHPEHGWQYNVWTWQGGPTWFPTPPWHTAGPLTLEELLDRINTFGDGPPMQKWLDLKAESGAFGTRR